VAELETLFAGVSKRRLKFEIESGVCWDGENILDTIASIYIACEIVASDIFDRIVGVFTTITDAFCFTLSEENIISHSLEIL
jgi:hypothetical protein